MQIYKAFFKIIKRNLPSISVYLGIFLILITVLSGSGKKNDESQFQQSKVSMTVLNEDQGTIGKQLESYLGETHELVTLPNHKDVLQDELYFRSISYILYIPENFTEKFLGGEREEVLRNIKVPGSTAGVFVDQQIQQFLSSLSVYMDTGFTEHEAARLVNNDLSIEADVQMVSEGSTETKPSYYYFFQYIPYISICVVMLGVSPTLMAFQRKEIFERNLCSAVTLKSKNFQLILGCVTVIAMLFAIFITMAIISYHHFALSPGGFFSMVNIFIFLLIALSMAFLASQLAQNTTVLDMASNTIGLGLSFLGGIFVPLEWLGDKMIQIAKFTPTYWYSTVNERVFKITSFLDVPNEVWTAYAIQLGFAVALFSIALLASRLKREARWR